MGGKRKKVEEKLLTVFYCRSNKGILVYNTKECHQVPWELMVEKIKEHELPVENIWICRDTFHNLESKEWIFCDCWKKRLFKKPPKIMAGTYCLQGGGCLYYDDESTEYEKNWENWQFIMHSVNKVWICPQALEKYGRPVDHLQIWNQCKCWLNKFLT